MLDYVHELETPTADLPGNWKAGLDPKQIASLRSVKACASIFSVLAVRGDS